MQDRYVECTGEAKGEVGERGGEVIDWLVESRSKVEVREGGGKVVYLMVENATIGKDEVGERRR